MQLEFSPDLKSHLVNKNASRERQTTHVDTNKLNAGSYFSGNKLK
jgi:hypothetical protein